MSAHIPEVPENVEDDEQEVEEASYRDINAEIHGRWVQAQKDLEAAKDAKDERAIVLAKNKVARVGDEFVRTNIGLAARVAKAFFNPGNDSSKDYLQAAQMGLWEAFLRWDPSRNVTFGTFSRLYIRGATHRGVRAVEYTQLSQTDFNLRAKVNAEQRTLTEKLGRTPTHKEIAQAIGATVPSVERALAQRAMSLETPVTENGNTLGDVIADREDEVSLSEVEAQQLESLFGALDARELWIMVQRNGLAGGPPQNLVEVADTIGIGREIARRTEKKAIEKLAKAATALKDN